MATDDDIDIILGSPVAATKEARDSDGDGVSDVDEELQGTNPADAADHVRSDARLEPGADDPRVDPERPTLEPEVGDPRAAAPDGTTLDTGLGGLTGLDGNPLRTGSDRLGIGDDDILTGRLGANSPRDAPRNPLGSTGDDKGAGGQGPPGQGPSGSTTPGIRNRDLYGNEDDLDNHDKPDTTPAPPPPDPGPPPTPPPPDPEPWQDDAPVPPPPDTPPPVPTTPDLGPDDMRDPDAGGSDTPSGGGRLGPGTIDGGDIDFVEGYGGPVAAGDAPPPRRGGLVTDPDEDGDVLGSTTSGPVSPPGSEVSRPVDPNDDIIGPRPPGSGDGDPGLSGTSSAATAAASTDPGAPAFSPVGPGTGPGIQTTIASDDGPGEGDDDPPPDPEDELVAGGRDRSIRPLDGGGADEVLGVAAAPVRAVAPTVEPAEPGAAAVDTFATAFLEDVAAPAPDLVAAGLVADLGADPRAVIDEPAPVVQLDPGGTELLEGSFPDDNDGVDV